MICEYLGFSRRQLASRCDILAFIAAVWSARYRHLPSILSSWLFMGIIIVNACGEGAVARFRTEAIF